MTQNASEGTQSFRLSPQQEQLWGGDPDGPRLTVRCLVDVNDADPAAVRDALRRVVGRHEILRTTFARRQGLKMPGQVIDDRHDVAWLEPDAHGRLDEAPPVDLGRGPVVQAGLSTRPDGHHLLALAVPAVCSDARSLALLAGELRAELAETAPQPAEPLQYADYAEWRLEALAAESPAWEFDDLPPSPDLPFVRQMSAETALPPLREMVPLDRDAVANGAAVCRVTEANFVEACWHMCLARLSGHGAILVGAVLDGRVQEELVDAIGPYSQMLPLVTTIDDSTTVAEVVDQVRRQRARLEQRQDSADADVLAHVAQRCRVGFSVIPVPAAAGVEELVGAPVPFFAHLCWLEERTAPSAELHVSPRLMDAGTAAVLSETLTAVVAAAASDVNVAVADLAVTQPGSAAAKLAALIGRTASFSRSTVTELFEAAAAKAHDTVALVAPDATLTYGELNARANRVAHCLREMGVTRNTTVALCMERSASSVVGLLGVLKAGGAYLPLNFEHPPARLVHQLSETEAPVLLTETTLNDRLPPFDGAVLHVDDESLAPGAASDLNPQPVNEPEDTVYVMYTSGSTGTPKGVCVTHRNLVAYTTGILERLDLTGSVGVAFAAVSALSTDLGNTSIFASLLGTGTLHLVSPTDSMDGSRFAEYLRSHPVDVLKITPSHLRALLAATETGLVLPNRWLVLGGEALSWQLAEQLLSVGSSCRLLNHYGPTEATIGTCTFEVGTAPPQGATVPVGSPLPGSRAYVVDRKLNLLPAGVPGELCIGGDGVARGYIAQPAQTQERFLPDPFADAEGSRLYRTGDRVRALPDGNVEFLGRVDDQVKIHGYRVEPKEVQVVLARHPAVRQCAVVARTGGDDDHELIAYVVCSTEVPTDELKALLRESLPVYMVPARFVELDALPLTPSGKIDRRALPDPAEVERVVEFVAPRTPLEEKLAGIWGELLGIERVGVHDDFFALGGHSLLATQAVIRIRNTITDIPLHSLFNAPTVSALAEAIVDSELESAGAHQAMPDQAS